MDTRLLIAAAALACGTLGWAHLHRIDDRIAELEEGPPVGSVAFEELAARLELIQAELAASREVLGQFRDGSEQSAELSERFREVEGGLREQHQELLAWRDEYTRTVAEVLERRLARLDEVVAEEWRRLEGNLEVAARVAQDNRGTIAELREREEPDPDLRWRDLLGPTVQLCGLSTVGSGVLLGSRPAETEGEWRTDVLTAWHVVRDILPESEGPEHLVPVRVYLPEGGFDEEQATLLQYDVELDVALLRLQTQRHFENGARLASRSRLERVRTFDRIYAVGCPLGNDPIPTFGEIAETRHMVEGEHYWMISAPTYIGNSGGGIYDAESGQLLGIFSKIYTHGSLRPTVVPHMGLAVPLTRIYDWLASRGLAELELAPTASAQPQVASAQIRAEPPREGE